MVTVSLKFHHVFCRNKNKNKLITIFIIGRSRQIV